MSYGSLVTFRALCAIAVLSAVIAACTRNPESVTPDVAQPAATRSHTDAVPETPTTSAAVSQAAADIAAAVAERTGPPSHDGPFFFSLALDGLTFDEHAAFIDGQFFFNEIWTQVGPRETPSDGLGPLFNARSCDACHRASGRRAGVSGDGVVLDAGLLVRLSVPGADAATGEPLPEPNYGDQLQDRTFGNQSGEALIVVQWDTEQGTYTDGTSWERRRPVVGFAQLSGPDLDPATQTSMRSAAPLIGMGLLEAIPEETILGLADPDDTDGDGISGRPNMVWDPESETLVVGRFGWKANVGTLEHQTALAFAGDIGITSPLIPVENCAPSQTLCADTRSGGTFEVSQERVDGTLDYLRGLAVPNLPDPPVSERGEELFGSYGCASCHTPSLATGSASLDILSDVTVAAFTDLLLHDMGDGLADGRTDGDASGSEWRTPPLWGLGQVNAASLNLLHDGRARSIEEAILWHEGEAEQSRQAFLAASLDDRRALLAFLGSL